MNNDRYRKIFEDLGRDLFAVAKRHGKRALREAVRDAAKGELIQEEGGEQNSDGDIPPEELDYPDESVWTLPPASDDEEEGSDDEEEQNDDEGHELSDAAERVLDRLMDELSNRTGGF